MSRLGEDSNKNNNGETNKAVSKSREASKYMLEIIVSDPQKQVGDQTSSSSYVTYQVSTKTNNPSYLKNHGVNKNRSDEIIVVHRRFSDLQLLYNILSNDHPTCIVPPLPDKKVFQYIAGDRFGTSFTQKRCRSLQNFLRRIASHPILYKSSVLEMFLVSNDWDVYRKSLSGNVQLNKDEMTDVFMNAFKTVHNQSEEFTEIKDKSEKLENNVNKIDKVFHKIVKKQDSISEDYFKISKNLQELQELVSNENEALSQKLRIFSEGIRKLSYGMNDLNKYIDYEYIVDLKDLEHYISSMKQLIKLKDQKQIDYEELSDYLTKSINEKNNLISGYYSSSNFLTNKLEEIAGINQESSRRDKIDKLEKKINALTMEVENAKKISDAFEIETLKEVELFESTKTTELRGSLSSLADHHIDFYQKMLDTWVQIDESL